jgi:hypothetical protein
MSDTMRSATKLVNMISEDPQLRSELKAGNDPSAVLREAASAAEWSVAPYRNDRVLYRIAIIVLSLLALLAAVGSIVITIMEKKMPEALVALGAASVGALVGLFAPSPGHNN